MAKKQILTAGAEVAAPPEIRELVEKFAEHRETYRRTGYNETQLRQDFLDPFFVALGWDVYNRQGFAEAYRDVILEQGLKVNFEEIVVYDCPVKLEKIDASTNRLDVPGPFTF